MASTSWGITWPSPNPRLTSGSTRSSRCCSLTWPIKYWSVGNSPSRDNLEAHESMKDDQGIEAVRWDTTE